MLGIVADIAYRAALLNPHFAEKAGQLTPGIVLIDEIDLHLHPKWQRRVVDDLRRTFPRVQFIATTHSPFIIQSLRAGELIDLEKKPSGEYVNRSIEDITEEVMGVPIPQRSYRYQQMYEAALEYYRMLQHVQTASPVEREKLKRRLDALVAPFSDNVAYHAFLEMQRIVAEHGVASDETS
jgi:predicted ATP-binding protein involved in virulence